MENKNTRRSMMNPTLISDQAVNNLGKLSNALQGESSAIFAPNPNIDKRSSVIRTINEKGIIFVQCGNVVFSLVLCVVEEAAKCSLCITDDPKELRIALTAFLKGIVLPIKLPKS